MLQLSEQLLLVADINAKDLLQNFETRHLHSDVGISTKLDHKRDDTYLVQPFYKIKRPLHLLVFQIYLKETVKHHNEVFVLFESLAFYE